MENIPACVGIILDGNRRWAKDKGLPKLEGHRAGLTTLEDITRSARDLGVAHLAVYLFSTENWKREESEVSYLMGLFLEMCQKQLTKLGEEGVRMRFVGQRERFSPQLQVAMDDIEQKTAQNDRITLWGCLSYGGRAEIVDAARKTAASGTEITEESLEGHMWTADMPNLDVLIRTSGEMRTSGFLTWKSVYAELFFVDKMWPDFTKVDLEEVLQEYAQRNRRMGK